MKGCGGAHWEGSSIITGMSVLTSKDADRACCCLMHPKTPKPSAQVLRIQGLLQDSLLCSSCLTSCLTWFMCQR